MTRHLPRLLRILFLPGALLLATAACAQEVPRARNVIVMIGDGRGFNQLAAGSLFQQGELGRLPYQRPGWVQLAMSTYSNGGGYDPAKAYADPEYLKQKATDSAAAATTLSTGVKTYNGAIGVGLDKQPLKHTLEYAEELGRATGVVSSVPFCHATPAGFSAHNAGRGNYTEIGDDMIGRSAADVVLGAGHPLFDAAGRGREAKWQYLSEATYQALKAGEAGADADGDGDADPWTLIETKEQFEALAAGALPGRRVFGLAPVSDTLQQGRGRNRERLTTVPSLATMAQGALRVLGEDPDGLFLMIEGGAIDWASHAGRMDLLVEEEADFNAAIQAVIDWVEANSNWDETLLVITADHETGYLTGPTADGKPDPRAALVGTGAGQLPGHAFHSEGHTNSLVPFFARGAGAERYRALATQTDPVRGPYLDNTELAKVVIAALAGRAAP